MSNPYQVGQPQTEDKAVKDAKLAGCMVAETKDDTLYRSMSTYTKCPSCQNLGPSHVTQAYSLLACLFAICCGCYYSLYVIHKNKDPNCKNAEHKCGGCGNTLANYTAC